MIHSQLSLAALSCLTETFQVILALQVLGFFLFLVNMYIMLQLLSCGGGVRGKGGEEHFPVNTEPGFTTNFPG